MATTYFQFTTLSGGDQAGYTSINNLIQSIDTILNGRVPLKKATAEDWSNYVPIYNPSDQGVSFVAGLIDTANITNAAITTDKIAADAVTTDKIGDAQVTTGKIAANAVTLGTKTSGNYVATIQGTVNQIAASGTNIPGAAHTISLASSATLPGTPTIQTPPSYSGGDTGNSTVASTLYVTQALSYATAGNVTLNGDVAGTASSNTIQPGTVNNDKVSLTAAIAYSKLNLRTGASGAGSVVNADISDSAAITYGKLNLRTGASGTGSIVNADIATAAAIVDSKLATISTAGKVANSATTATNANTANAIVARDASGNFSAGTITAALSGNASTATDLAGGSAGAVVYQAGSNNSGFTAVGSSGQLLRSNGTSAPSWTNASSLSVSYATTAGSASADGGTAANLYMSGDAYFTRDSTNGMRVGASGGGSSSMSGKITAGSFTTSSSRRYKENITNYIFDVTKILALQPVTYNYIGVDDVSYGFIAEDAIEAGVTEFVAINENDEAESFNYVAFTTALLAVCQEQQAQIEALEARVAALEV